MKKDEFLTRLQSEIVSKQYKTNLSERVPDDCLLWQQGAYLCLALPYVMAPAGDYGSSFAKGLVKKAVTCIPIILEKGLFLIYYGPHQAWEQTAVKFTVDKTGLRPVILQSIHFIDYESGANVNSRSHWGPIQFGFCSELIADLEALCAQIAET